jgi:hypothetical protein
MGVSLDTNVNLYKAKKKRMKNPAISIIKRGLTVFTMRPCHFVISIFFKVQSSTLGSLKI